MYATHGHGDHWFGFAEVAKRFPDAQILGTKGTVALAQYQTTGLMDYWNSQFPGQIVKDVIVPTAIDGHTFDLEGHEVRFVEAGDSDRCPAPACGRRLGPGQHWKKYRKRHERLPARPARRRADPEGVGRGAGQGNACPGRGALDAVAGFLAPRTADRSRNRQPAGTCPR